MNVILTPGPRPVGAPSGGGNTATWQQDMREAVRDAGQLCRLLQLPQSLAEEASGSNPAGFSLFVPRPYLARMRPGDPDDPLLRQILPRRQETQSVAGFSPDPIAEREAIRAPGLLQKYAGRVLMVTSGACPVHCRYCFRRHFPYGASPPSAAVWEASCRRIGEDRSLREVILSGGDPLAIPDGLLSQLVARLGRIDQLRTLRIHTRFPVMIPARITDSLLACLSQSRLTPVLVMHANHAAELDDAVARAAQRLASAGVLLLNQAVLLAGVNDRCDVLAALCQRLVEMRVVPYYLHQLDRVQGAAHFEVPVEKGLRLIEQLRRCLPGYAVPRYVREIGGAPYKVDLAD